MTNFVLQAALHEADIAIANIQKIIVSEHDYLQVIDLIENPPAPNAKMKAAMAAFLALPDFK